MWKWNTDYIIVDDFLKPKYFEFLKNVQIEKSGVYSHSIDKEGNIFQSGGKIPDDILMEIHKAHTPKLLKYLKKLAPELVEKLTFTEIALIATAEKQVYPIHPDTSDKILSVVVYISPENNIGTNLYRDKEGKDKYTVEWKQNRALIFSRTDNTWHSYNSDGKSQRVALVYNLRQDDVSKVLETLKIRNDPTLHKQVLQKRMSEMVDKKKDLVDKIKESDSLIKKYTKLKKNLEEKLASSKKAQNKLKARVKKVVIQESEKNKSTEPPSM